MAIEPHLERLSWAAYRAIWAVYVPSARIHTASAPVDLDVNFLKRGEKTKGVHTASERGTRATVVENGRGKYERTDFGTDR